MFFSEDSQFCAILTSIVSRKDREAVQTAHEVQSHETKWFGKLVASE